MYVFVHSMYSIHACLSSFISVHPVECLYMIHLGSSWFTCFCWKHSLEVCHLYLPELGCTSFKEIYGTGISHQGSYRYVPLRMAVAGGQLSCSISSNFFKNTYICVCQRLYMFNHVQWCLHTKEAKCQVSCPPATAILREYIPVWTLHIQNNPFLYTSIV